jgi:hypothetical protein
VTVGLRATHKPGACLRVRRRFEIQRSEAPGFPHGPTKCPAREAFHVHLRQQPDDPANQMAPSDAMVGPSHGGMKMDGRPPVRHGDRSSEAQKLARFGEFFRHVFSTVPEPQGGRFELTDSHQYSPCMEPVFVREIPQRPVNIFPLVEPQHPAGPLADFLHPWRQTGLRHGPCVVLTPHPGSQWFSRFPGYRSR